MSNERARVETAAPILIVGAGPTGLVLALWLTKLGIAVRIIDKTAAAGTTSRALAVQARTLEFYQQVGLAEAVAASGVKIAEVNLWVWGVQAARLPLRNIGQGITPFPFALVFPQDEHERLLIERLRALGVNVERQTELLHFEQHSADVRAVLRRHDGEQDICTVSYLAGCDGASSTVRELLGIGFPGGTYQGLFYVADVQAAGPAVDRELHVDLDEADILLVFPLQGSGRVRLVGNVREPPGDRELTFADVSSRVIEQLQLKINQVNWFSTYRVHHRVADHFRADRVFLLGDAAHIHSPVGGQGMNTGIGDAVNLAWKLAAVLKNRAAERLLDSYETERSGFAQRLVATTDRVFTLVTAPGRGARFIRTRLVPLLAPWLFRIHGMRHFFFRTVSQTGIQYRRSPLSTGAAGVIRGGDRLPWAETGPQEDNFAPLAAFAWQVHAYGEPTPSLAAACAELGLLLHRFPWTTAVQRAGFLRGALYLIRPDGYVALADSHGDPQSLERYFASRGLICQSQLPESNAE